MAESITISKLPPPFESMQYALLRETGLKHLQDLSGKIWTDDNAHDPGITLLELLSYAITDLGYRTNYNIRDILATDPNVPEDIRNFFQAKEIMPNFPVTLNDYRKLMIDVEVPVDDVDKCDSVGVKNAWIFKSPENEIPYYVDAVHETLSYSQQNPPVNRQLPQVLYDVLFEFNECEGLGDLNENILRGVVTIQLISPLPPASPITVPAQPVPYSNMPADLNGLNIELEVEFPRWDTEGVDWDDLDSIINNTTGINLKFLRLPEKYTVGSYGLVGPNNKSVFVSMFAGFINPVDTTMLSYQVADYIYNQSTGLVVTYQKKVKYILEILAAAKKSLMAHRNLGEDFFRFNAIKVEEILLCGDIELTNDANVEQVQADIYHQVERFLSPTIFFYSLSEMYAKGKTTDEIFEGPKLDHGFIDDEELTRADRRSVIHVSDIISIIMDVPGVIAAKNIRIANIPLDNDDQIPSHAMKWCLQLAIDKNYVPRLSTERSNIVFFKDQLPYHANQLKVQELLDALEAADRPQKLINPSFDIPIEAGEYKEIEDYYSIQEELPLVYGTSSAGLPATADTTRKAQAKQLKAFMIFFEQLLADYLSQLAHVKDLFSMNDGKDSNGDPIINKTYFTQSLMNIIPDGLPLYVDENDPAQHAKDLQAYAEDLATYEERRNRFLDHMMARFAESFSDYALVVYKIDGPKAPADLIQDKLAFLNNYPLISSARDTAFNYKDPCKLWHLENISGLERRADYLCGVDKPQPDSLAFSVNFGIIPAATADEYCTVVYDSSSNPLIYNPGGPVTGYSSTSAAKAAMELLIVNGVQSEKYAFFQDDGTPVPDPTNPPTPLASSYYFTISCDGQTVGKSVDFATAGDALTAVETEALPAFLAEFMNNPESNRYNLECFMDKYVTVLSTDPEILPPDPPCPSEYLYHYSLTNGETPSTTLLTGILKGLTQEFDPPVPDAEQAANNKERLLMDMLRSASSISNYRFGFDPLDPTKEVFTVVDRCGDVIGTSFEEEFNQYILDSLNSIRTQSPPAPPFEITGSTGNDGSYTAMAVAWDFTDARRLQLVLNQTLPSGIADGFFKYTVSAATPALQPNVIDANIADNFFEVDKSLSRIVFPGEKITVTGDDAGEYTVLKIVPSGITNSLIYVKETIPSTSPVGSVIEYTKLLPIVAIDMISGPYPLLYVQPGADLVAAQELADWTNQKFFSHEGMHVLEHILLRPKYNSTSYDAISAANGLSTTTSPFGDLIFLRNFASYTIDQPNKKFSITGDFVSELPVFAKLKIIGSANEGTYTIRSAVFASGTTTITIYESIPDTANDGTLQFSASKPITAISSYSVFEITDTESSRLPSYADISVDVIIKGSGSVANDDLGINDGIYRIAPVTPAPGSSPITLTLTEKKVAVRDNFLPIDTHNECPICQFEAPYSFIVTVVLPSWQGRFVSPDFRRFFDRTLRLECPAHLVLNICWISCEQMGEYESKYKTWLLENAREVKDQPALTKALNELINVLLSLRSVYREGTLHDCEADTQPNENAVILNQTIIGTL